MKRINNKERLSVAVQWPHFGPYHKARLNSAFTECRSIGMDVIGIEIASKENLYSWWSTDETPIVFQHYVVIPDKTYENILPLTLFKGIISALNKINPDVMVINGYSYYDTWSCLFWCKLNRRPIIMMSDSKQDDRPRTFWREVLKRYLVKQYDAAICGGKLSRQYLEALGMGSERIFDGVDTVDNDLFFRGAEDARQNRSLYYHLPGLESDDPFFLASARFVKGKNLDGLIRAYAIYRCRLSTSNKNEKPWRLVILGDGPERDLLENIIRTEGVEGVYLPGFIQGRELYAYLGLCNALIHPSLKDTWGLVVNEAMAVGLPVLVSRRAGCAADLVSEGINGFTFDPEDLETIAELMVCLSSGQVDLSAMSSASYQLIANWGTNRFALGLKSAVKVVLS